MGDPASSILRPADQGSTGELRLVDRSLDTKLLVRSDHGPDVPLGGTVRLDGARIAAFRPQEWLIVGDADACHAAARPVDEGFTSIVDVTHGRVMLRLDGPTARAVLGTLCNLDLTDAMTPPGAATSAAVAGVACDIIRDDRAPLAYDLLADRSFGQYLYDEIVVAARAAAR